MAEADAARRDFIDELDGLIAGTHSLVMRLRETIDATPEQIVHLGELQAKVSSLISASGTAIQELHDYLDTIDPD